MSNIKTSLVAGIDGAVQMSSNQNFDSTKAVNDMILAHKKHIKAQDIARKMRTEASENRRSELLTSFILKELK